MAKQAEVMLTPDGRAMLHERMTELAEQILPAMRPLLVEEERDERVVADFERAQAEHDRLAVLLGTAGTIDTAALRRTRSHSAPEWRSRAMTAPAGWCASWTRSRPSSTTSASAAHLPWRWRCWDTRWATACPSARLREYGPLRSSRSARTSPRADRRTCVTAACCRARLSTSCRHEGSNPRDPGEGWPMTAHLHPQPPPITCPSSLVASCGPLLGFEPESCLIALLAVPGRPGRVIARVDLVPDHTARDCAAMLAGSLIRAGGSRVAIVLWIDAHNATPRTELPGLALVESLDHASVPKRHRGRRVPGHKRRALVGAVVPEAGVLFGGGSTCRSRRGRGRPRAVRRSRVRAAGQPHGTRSQAAPRARGSGPNRTPPRPGEHRAGQPAVA